MDMKESKHVYEVEAELPGVNKDDIHLECKDDRTLLLTGQFGTATKESTTEAVPEQESDQNDLVIEDSDGVIPTGVEKERRHKISKRMHDAVAKQENQQLAQNDQHRYWHSERMFGQFQRFITFPTPIQADKIKASYKNGLLSILLPKVEKKGVTVNVE